MIKENSYFDGNLAYSLSLLSIQLLSQVENHDTEREPSSVSQVDLSKFGNRVIALAL